MNKYILWLEEKRCWIAANHNTTFNRSDAIEFIEINNLLQDICILKIVNFV